MKSTSCQRSAYRFRVSGRVQGVFFRQSTLAEAQRLDVCGWVRNCADGSVQGLATGTDAALQQLHDWLQHGPSAARVDALDWTPVDEPSPDDFRVLR